MHARCLLCTLLLTLTLGVLAAPGLAADPSQILTVSYDVDGQTIAGTMEILLPDPPETAYFLLLPNLAREVNPHLAQRVLDEEFPFGFEPAAIEVHSVLQGQSGSETALAFRLLSLPPVFQTYSLGEAVLAVDLDRVEPPARLVIGFVTRVPRRSSGDEGITNGILTWRFGWHPTLLEPQGTLVEDAGQIRYSDLDAFPLLLPWVRSEAEISYPRELELFTGAHTVTRSDSPEEDAELAVARLQNDTPTRSLGITLGADYARYVLSGDPMIEVGYLPGHEEEARLLATYARDILANFGERFGPYRHPRLVIMESANETGTSFAADGIVWLSRLFFTHRDVPLAGFLNGLIEFVLAHEIAHQWFGLGTGVDLDTDAWLSEGLSQYAAISYYESRHGADEGNLFQIVSPGLLEDLIDRQLGFYNLREHQIELPYLLTVWSGFDEELVKATQDIEYANASSVRVYDKGYLVARALASLLGDQVFDRALREAVEDRRGQRLDVRAVQQFLEEEADRSLDVFFEAWLFGDMQVDYSVSIASRRRTPAGHETEVVVTRDGGPAFPVEVEATLMSDATVRKTWNSDAETGTLVFHTPSYVRRVTIDPDHRLPDRERLNNNAPVKIVGAVNQALLPLDAYVISPDAESGGFRFSYLDRVQIRVDPASASLTIREGRHDQYDAHVSIADDRLTGDIAYTYVAYHQPNTGSPAITWEPDVAYTIGARRLFSVDDPYLVLRLAALELPSVNHSGSRAVSLDLIDTGSTQLSVSAFDEFRLLPRFYLQGSVSLGFAIGQLPTALKHPFDELRTFTISPSDHWLSGVLALEIPASGELPYNLLNLAMVDRSRTQLYATGGVGWTALGYFGKTSPCVEAGVAQILDLSTLGGLLPLQVRFGVAVPIVGDGVTVLFGEISL